VFRDWPTLYCGRGVVSVQRGVHEGRGLGLTSWCDTSGGPDGMEVANLGGMPHSRPGRHVVLDLYLVVFCVDYLGAP
jgi:hypothetical protein